MEKRIKQFRSSVQENILKAFGGAPSLQKAVAEEFEKAKHQVGDIHPNGKWVWSEYKPGKFDWRAKGTKAAKEALQESGNKTPTKEDNKPTPPMGKHYAGQEDNSSKKVKAKIAPEVKACRKAVRQIGDSGNFYSKGIQIVAYKNHLSGGYGFDFTVNPHIENWEKKFDAVLKDFAKTYGVTLPKNKVEKNKGLRGDIVFSWNLGKDGKLK